MKIKKGKKVIDGVSEKTYHIYFKSAGWIPDGEEDIQKPEPAQDDLTEDEPVTETEEDNLEVPDGEEDIQKPLGEMKLAELKEFGEKLGLDMSTYTAKKDAVLAIKEKQEA